MKGGVRKRGNTWYYYFDMGIVDGKRKKSNVLLKELKRKPKLNQYYEEKFWSMKTQAPFLSPLR